MTRMPRTRRPILALVVLALCAGCAAKRPFSDADAGANALAEGTPPQVAEWLKGLHPATESASGSQLLPMASTERPFGFTLNGESRMVIYRIAPVKEGPFTATVSWSNAATDALISLQRMSVTEDGSVVSVASVNTDRGVESRFRPPLPILDGVMSPGTPHTSTHDVAVADMDRPGRITHRGRANASIELVGENTVTVADRQVRCMVVRASFDATFGPAVVNRVSYQWYEPGVGMVGEYVEETVRTLGVQTEKRREWWMALE